MNKDLTVGNPGKILLLYTLPLFGSIIFQQLYNVADSFVAGFFIGTQALAAVGNSYEITLIYIAFAFGCNIGASVVTAKYFGVKDYASARTTAYTALISSVAIGIVLMAIGLGVSRPLLKLMQTPADILEDSLLYLYIYLGGYLFLLVYNIATGIFASLGDSVTPFIFLVVSSVGNVGMDILFVKSFHMGVDGVAWATFICQGISGIAALVTVLIRLKKLSDGKAALFDKKILKEITIVAIPSVLQQGFISVGNIVIQGFINSFGTAAIAGYSAAIKLNNLSITSLCAVGNGLSNYSAQNAGAGKNDRIKKGLIYGIAIAVVLAGMFTALFLIFGRTFTELFVRDGNADAIATSMAFLTIVTPFYALVSVKIMVDGVYRGINQMYFFVISTFTDLILRVVFAAIFAKTLGINGIWYSWPIGWGVSTTISCSCYFYVRKKRLGTARE